MKRRASCQLLGGSSSFLASTSGGALAGIGQTLPGNSTLPATPLCMSENKSSTENSSDPLLNSEGVVLRIRKCNQPSRGAPRSNGAAYPVQEGLLVPSEWSPLAN